MKIKMKMQDNEPYSVVILYKGRMEENECRYTIYSRDSRVLKKTEDKYELMIYLDLMGLEMKRILDDGYRVRNFTKKWFGGIFKIGGKAFKLGKKTSKLKRKIV